MEEFEDNVAHLVEAVARANAISFVDHKYVVGKDWSEYDGRIAPKKLPLVKRLTSLCEKLQNAAQGNPPRDVDGLPYVWSRCEFYSMRDSREGVHHLIPPILHYLGVSDPCSVVTYIELIKHFSGVGLIEADENFFPLLRIFGSFLWRLWDEKIVYRPTIKEVVEFFELAKTVVEKSNAGTEHEEALERLKIMAAPQEVAENNFPTFSNNRWWLFVELSRRPHYQQDVLRWRKLAKVIADKKHEYTAEQRQFLRNKLKEYREEQVDKNEPQGKYQEIIDTAGSDLEEEARDLFPRGEEKEALINLMEEIKITQKWDEVKGKIRDLGEVYFNTVQLLSLVQMAEDYPAIDFNNPLVRKMLMRLENPPVSILTILSIPVNKRTPEQHEQFNASLGLFREASIYKEVQKEALTYEIALEVFCANDSSKEQRKYMAKYIAEKIFEYSGDEVVQFFNKLKEYKLDGSLAGSIRKRRGISRVIPVNLDESEIKIKDARDSIVAALKAYRSSLFYFNPKRLSISHVINVLNDPWLQSEKAELIEPEYAEILDKVLRFIPRRELQAFSRSKKPFRKYNKYELVRTPHGKVFAIDKSQCLGEGSFGVVYVAYEVNKSTGKFGKRVAVKFFKKDNTHEEILNEAKAIAKSFDIEGVVSGKNQTCLVMEYVEGKPIAKKSWRNGIFEFAAAISTLPLVERFKAIVMLIAEVSAAHQHRNRGNAFLHLDINIKNIHLQINNGKLEDVRLLDFGLAKFISSPDPKSAVFPPDDGLGTPGFAAPESEKTLKSDMRSLLPTILPLLGVNHRLFNGQDVDRERGSVRYFLLEGLLRGMEKELPIRLRAALFQFITKMESYEDADARPSDDEAFRFFNALFNYCRAADKNKWHEIEYHQELQQAYSGIIPRNAQSWFEHLREEQDPLLETKAEIQRTAEMVFGQVGDLSVKNQLRLLKYFIENEEADDQNKTRWESVLKWVAKKDLEKEDFVELMRMLNKKREHEPAVVFTLRDEPKAVLALDAKILEIFKRLSKTKNYEVDQASWKITADMIIKNIDNYSGSDLLIILRKINKFNSKNEYDKLRDAVKAKLNAHWSDACAKVREDLGISDEGISWNRSAMNNLKAAIDGEGFFAHRRLRIAVSESPNEAVGRVVRKLGKVAA